MVERLLLRLTWVHSLSLMLVRSLMGGVRRFANPSDVPSKECLLRLQKDAVADRMEQQCCLHAAQRGLGSLFLCPADGLSAECWL